MPSALGGAVTVVLAALLAGGAGTALAADWPSPLGGNSAHNGLVPIIGPTAPAIVWRRTIPSASGRPMVAQGDRLFLPEGLFDGNDHISARSVASGKQLWKAVLPPHPTNPQAWPYVMGASGGRVYASRSYHGGPDRLYCLSASDGSVLWASVASYDFFYLDGLAFAPDGDPVVGATDAIVRLEAASGSEVWRTTRAGSFDGSAVALHRDKLYSWELSSGGMRVAAFALANGERLYASPPVSLIGPQQANLFAGTDGTVYAPRCQGNPTTDFLVALRDTGTGLEERWRTPMAYVPFAALAVGADGSVYSVSRAAHLLRLDPESGDVQNQSEEAVYPIGVPVRITTDAAGGVYVAQPDGLHAYDRDLAWRWTVPLDSPYASQPVLVDDGRLIMNGVNSILELRDVSQADPDTRSNLQLPAAARHSAAP